MTTQNSNGQAGSVGMTSLLQRLPDSGDEKAWTPEVVHALAASIDPQRPCTFCGTKFASHLGEFTVIPDEVYPTRPAVFGSKQCAERWAAQKAVAPAMTAPATADGRAPVLVDGHGGLFLPGDVIDDSRIVPAGRTVVFKRGGTRKSGGAR